MATYYDGLNDFFKLNEQDPLQTSAQLVYLHLLQLNNRFGNSGQVQVSDRELEHLTSLNKNTITTAKRILKNRGLVDFKTDGKNPRLGTTYTLNFFVLGQTLGQKAGQTPIQTLGQSVGQSLSNSFLTSTQEDLRLKKEDQEKSTITTIACASAGVNRDFGLDEILDYWEQSRFGKLDIELISKLEIYLDRYGYAEVKAAMDAAKSANGSPYGVSFKYFASVLENRNTPKMAKGGKKNVATDTPEYRAPRRTSGDWDDYEV